ncbi:MAG: S-adenosylmethionine:tRNA ribosyltransferase-isomerase [Candidatus Pseudobacter hemicellulosilyticus]|uniref:S-adenosylmethionine:tRNA ribosyltransferase-isomerase n=1 Tax=Candidatus Pseudobacter hemicellulosilyticus TaxID=3121375 RepID=A0AAJ5WT25_9BACT|nr:MAG: S-adenosylmethionine:tRNA ribosyltransferase-isomerase [Pseudobacter sp.]
MDPRAISIQDFTYELPEERIAWHPLPERDASRLLVYKSGRIDTDTDQYRNLPQYLPERSLLVFNNTKVVEARLLFQKATGARIEIFCLEPGPQYPDITSAMTQTGQVEWLCLVGGASKWKPGQLLEKELPGPKGPLLLQARYLRKEPDSFAIELSWNDDQLSFAELLHLAGQIPLPPYIKRSAATADQERYQTIYARSEGSVAAPTAGLHFTQAIFEKLAARHITRTEVTLHVGAGTFQPVKAATMEAHNMHLEFIDVTAISIRELLQHLDGHITAVGTTSLRTIESLYWLGVKTLHTPELAPEELTIGQWDAYELPGHYTANAALTSLLAYMEKKGWERLLTKTQLLIAPGYTIRIPKALVTNFHQPQSTLLLLVAAFVGADWRRIYDFALQQEFRFLSYGDGCLLFTPPASSAGTPA